MRMSRLYAGMAAFGLIAACGGEDPVAPADRSPEDAAAAIVMVSGDDQEGKAGEFLEEPLVVRVTDARGIGLSDIRVNWRVTAGAGGLAVTPDGETGDPASTWTDGDGLTRLYVEPLAVGTISVAAHVANRGDASLQGAPLTFTARASVLVIAIVGGWGYCPPASWCQPWTVPVGTTVEWVNADVSPHTVTTSSVPEGGAAFDSGTLDPGERFEFVFEVPGTWEYFDRIAGADALSSWITVQ